jgi:hypothetical protein
MPHSRRMPTISVIDTSTGCRNTQRVFSYAAYASWKTARVIPTPNSG